MIIDLFEVEKMQKKEHFQKNLDTGIVVKSGFYKSMILPSYRSILVSIDKQTTCFEYFF